MSRQVIRMHDGLKSAWEGIRFIIVTPALWPWALVPAAFMVVLTCALSGFGIWAASWATEATVGEVNGVWPQIGSWVLYLALLLTALLAAFLLALFLAQPFSGFALERISLAQERALLGHAAAEASFLAATYASLKAALVVLPIAVFVLTPLFLIDLFFPPAALVTIPLKLLFGGWLLAWNFIDYPLSLRGYGVRARLRWASTHFAAFTTFGLVWALLLPIPGIYLFVLPMGVAGATCLVVACERPPMRGSQVMTKTPARRVSEGP